MTRAATSEPWLTIIGIGEEGRPGLGFAAQRALDSAELVVGGLRHLSLAQPLPMETMTWPSPIALAIPLLMARRGRPTCILASGDPFHYGIGRLIAEHFTQDEFACHAAPSSFSLAAAKLGWSLQDCQLVSVHGRELSRLVRYLQPNAKILCLSWNAGTPRQIAELCVARGLGASKMWTLEALCRGRERIQAFLATEFTTQLVEDLNIVALEIRGSVTARIASLAPGMPDDWFEHDGQITKPEVRAATLAALRPRRGEHLWDVGAGCGSIAIEWSLLDPANIATAIESDPIRAIRIRRNAATFGVSDLKIVEALAPQAFAGLPPPDAIFIGGGSGNDGVVSQALTCLRAGGRVVVNGLTLETHARLIALFNEKGGEFKQMTIAHAVKVGRLHGWRPAMPIMQWIITKP